MQAFLFGVGLFRRWMWQSLPSCSPLCKWLCYSPYKTPFEIELSLWLALKCGRRDMSDFWASSLLCRSALEFDLVEASYHVRKSGLPSGRSNMESKAPQDERPHGKKCRVCLRKQPALTAIHCEWRPLGCSKPPWATSEMQSQVTQPIPCGAAESPIKA